MRPAWSGGLTGAPDTPVAWQERQSACLSSAGCVIPGPGLAPVVEAVIADGVAIIVVEVVCTGEGVVVIAVVAAVVELVATVVVMAGVVIFEEVVVGIGTVVVVPVALVELEVLELPDEQAATEISTPIRRPTTMKRTVLVFIMVLLNPIKGLL